MGSFIFISGMMAALAAFTVILPDGCGLQSDGCGLQSESPTITDENQNERVDNIMYRENAGDLKPGIWGGRGINIAVKTKSVSVDLDCGSVIISSRPKIGKDGKFVVTGLLTRSGPGPIRLDSLPQPQPVRIEGRVKGKQMNLKITLVDSGDLVGSYILERDATGRLVRCY